MKCLILFFITLSHQAATIMASLRIFQGTSAAPGEYPYAVRLEYKDIVHPETKVLVPFIMYCSGALIAPNWVLSAAHCNTKETYKEQRIARFGPIPTEDMANPEYFSNIERCFPNPGYKPSSMRWAVVSHDIGLCKLAKSVIVKKYGRLSSLDFKSLIGYEVVALGYGLNDVTGVIAETLTAKAPLQKATYLLVECSTKRTLSIFYFVINVYPVICMAPKCGISSTIGPGDSGGPIVHKSGIVAVAIASTTTNIFDGKYYKPEAGVITVVSPYIDWIVQVVQNN